jgi:predicted secreted protein with PEFG-CTERM motif
VSHKVNKPMKTKILGTFFVLLAIVAGIAATVPSASADHATAEVRNAPGSSAPGCEVTNECFIPHTVTVDVGGEVTWLNDDTAAHTATSGTAKDGPDGNFDSSLVIAGSSFSHKFDKVGEYPYFCMVHPWMTGVVIVQEAMGEEEKPMMEETMTTVKGMSKDGTIEVKITADKPTAQKAMTVKVDFMDKSGKAVSHINYDITASQEGKQVLNKMAQHQHEGKGSHMTDALSSDKPVDIKVTLQGIGIEAPFTGPKGEIVTFQVVPEFGTIAVMILGVAIVSIIAVTARSKVIPRL